MGTHETPPEAGADAPASALSGGRDDPPLESFRIWPNRSLPFRGYVWVLVFTGVMLSIPLVPLLGSPVGWTLLPFLLAALGALAYFLRRNTTDGAAQWEELCIWPDLITVERHDPGQPPRFWRANPYWVEVTLQKDAPLENYLTIKGEGRVIELGAFLSPEERLTLHGDLLRALSAARNARTAPARGD